MDAQDAYARAELAQAARARRARGALRASCSTSTRSARRCKRGGRYFYTRTHARQGEGDRLLARGRGRRRAGAARPEHAGRTDGTRLARRLVRRAGTARRSRTPMQAEQLRRGDAARARRRRPARCSTIDVIAGRASTPARRGRPTATASITTWLPTDRRQVTVAERPGLRRAALPQARRRSGEGRARPRDDRRPEDVPRRRHLARRPLAVRRTSQHGWNATDVYFKRRCAKGEATWQPLVVGQGRARTTSTSGSDRFYVHDQRGRAALPRLQGRSARKPDARRRGRRSSPRTRTRRSRASSVVGEHLVLTLPARTPRARSRSHDLDGKLRARGRRCPASAPRRASSATRTRTTAYFAFSVVHRRRSRSTRRR